MTSAAYGNEADVRRAALFVDFDNIFSGLEAYYGAGVARSFGANPGKWIDWLASLDGDGSAASSPVRRILLRKCYLNPARFSGYRNDFTRAACEVVDFPSLTQRGKSAADIHMALDIVEALAQREPPFDEFIVMSGDADFTPVLLRLRRRDRRIVVVAASVASAAYTGVAETVVEVDSFVRKALELEGLEDTRPVSRAPAPVATKGARLEQLASKLREVVMRRGDVLRPHEIPAGVFRDEGDFANSNWYGFWSLRRLVIRLVELRPDLEISREDDDEDWAVVRLDRGPAEGARDDPLEVVERHVGRSEKPVLGAALALLLHTRFPDDVWFGHPSFRTFLAARLPEVGLRQEISGTSHFVYDPARHALPSHIVSMGSEHLVDAAREPELHELSERLRRLSNLPPLNSEVYAALFRLVGEVVRSGDEDSTLSTISRELRDRIVEEGFPVSRAATNWILRGLQIGGCDFDDRDGDWDPATLASKYRQNVQAIVENAELDLDEAQNRLLDEWLKAK